MEEQRKKRNREEFFTSTEDVILKDFIDDILVKLPLKDLARFHCVSKSWSSSIIPRILKTVKTSSKLIVSSPGQIQIVDHEALSSSSSSNYVEMFDFPLKEAHEQVLGSSNGFLCIGFEGNNNHVLWNPLTKEYKHIAEPVVEMGDRFHFMFIGFGYDNRSDDYKIVRRFDFKMMVYSLKMNSWRVSKTIPFCVDMHKIFENVLNIGTLVNGTLYWPVTHVSDWMSYLHRARQILRLDLADEKHSWFQPPSDVDERYGLNLMVFKENKLCAYQSHNHIGINVIEMWVLEEEGEEFKCWTKLMSIQSEGIILVRPLSFRKNGEVVLQVRPQPPNCLYVYNPEEKSFERFEISGMEDGKYVQPTYEETIQSLRIAKPAAAEEYLKRPFSHLELQNQQQQKNI